MYEFWTLGNSNGQPSAVGKTEREVRAKIEGWFCAGTLHYQRRDDETVVRDYRNEVYGFIRKAAKRG